MSGFAGVLDNRMLQDNPSEGGNLPHSIVPTAKFCCLLGSFLFTQFPSL